MTKQSILAAFDVDGTLTTRDCVLPFMCRVAGRARVGRVGVRNGIALAQAAFGHQRDAAKARLCRDVFGGRDVAMTQSLGASFAEHVQAVWLRPDTLARLRWHQREGHRTALVSASLDPYLLPLGASLGVDDVVCTELEVGSDGRFTGGLVDGNCRGPEKVRRLAARFGRADVVYAYGDSAGDRELLAWADHGVLVRRTTVSEAP